MWIVKTVRTISLTYRPAAAAQVLRPSGKNPYTHNSAKTRRGAARVNGAIGGWRPAAGERMSSTRIGVRAGASAARPVSLPASLQARLMAFARTVFIPWYEEGLMDYAAGVARQERRGPAERVGHPVMHAKAKTSFTASRT